MRRCSWATGTSWTRCRTRRRSGSWTGSRRSRPRPVRRVMIKGLLAHKLRLALTALSVVLGVGFVAGTFVLTDTLAHTFDNLFAEVNSKTDGQIRSTQKLSPQDPAESDRGPVPASLLATVQKTSGAAEAGGYVQGRSAIVGKDGKM